MRRMRIPLLVSLLTILLLFSTGCSSGSEPNEVEDSAYQAQEDSIAVLLSGEVTTSSITATESEGRIHLAVSVSSYGEVTNFGNYVLAVRAAFESEFAEDERDSFSVTMPIKGTNPTLLRFSSSDYSDGLSCLNGTISDNRSGEVVFTDVTCLEDLFEVFPAARTYADEKGYTQ